MIFCVLIFKDLHRDYDTPSDDQIHNLQNRIGSFFFIAISLFVSSITNSGIKMSVESNIIYKEISSGLYGPSVYFWAKSLIDLLILLPLTAIVTVCYFYLLSLRGDSDMFVQFMEFSIWATLIANAIGLFIGSLTHTLKVVMLIIPMVFTFTVLLAGFVVNTS